MSKPWGQEPKIVLFDIENAPLEIFAWGTFEENAVAVKQHGYLLSFAWKELGEEKTHYAGLPDFKGYKRDRKDDYKLCEKLHEVMSNADILVAHNGRAHDVKYAMSRFAYHSMQPPDPFKVVDTLLVARTSFKFTSGNSLNALAQFLGVGEKLPNTGFDLWKGCMDGDPKSWTEMERYNKHDVVILEKCYLRMRPFMATHPRLDWYTREIGDNCPTCQSKKIYPNGLNASAAGFRQRMRCKDCGKSWAVGKLIKAA